MSSTHAAFHCANAHHPHFYPDGKVPSDGYCNHTTVSCTHRNHRPKGKHPGDPCGYPIPGGACQVRLIGQPCGAKIIDPKQSSHKPQSTWYHCADNSAHRYNEPVAKTLSYICSCGGKLHRE